MHGKHNSGGGKSQHAHEGSVLLSCSTSLKLEVIEVPEQRPIPLYMPIYTSSIDKPKFTEQYVVYQNEIIEIYDKNNPNRVNQIQTRHQKTIPIGIHWNR